MISASMQFGGALGLAVLSAAASDRTNTVFDAGEYRARLDPVPRPIPEEAVT